MAKIGGRRFRGWVHLRSFEAVASAGSKLAVTPLPSQPPLASIAAPIGASDALTADAMQYERIALFKFDLSSDQSICRRRYKP